MQIRIQGRQVQLIRATYSPEKKRAVAKVVAHFPRHVSGPGPDVLALLKEEEQAQLQEWLQKRAQEKEDYEKRTSAITASTFIRQITQAVELMTPLQAEAVWEEISSLQKALKKAGFKKPEKSKQPAKIEGQLAFPE